MPLRFTPPKDLTRYAAYIFDCDGTLIDSMPAHFIAWREALRAGGARFDFSWDEFLSRAGMSLERTVAELELKFDQALDLSIIARTKSKSYERLADAIVPVEEVVSFARNLAGEYPLAVATGSRRGEVEAILARLELLDLFDTLVTPEDVEYGKPEPDMFLLAARRMNVSPTECLVLEDGATGIEAARRAGMDCAVVHPGLMPGQTWTD